MIKIPLSLAWFCVFLSAVAGAADFHSPRTAALGGAGHASPLLNDALYLNPSYASFLPTYGIGVHYMNGNFGGTQKTRSLNASIQDGRSELFQAGVGMTLRDDGKLINLGASKALGKEFALGLGGKLVLPNNDRGGSGTKMLSDVNFSASYIATEWLSLSVTGDNLIQSEQVRARGMLREITLGSKFNVEGIFLVYADPHLTMEQPKTKYSDLPYGYQFGLEFPLLSDLFLRFGRFANSYVPFFQSPHWDAVHHGSGYGFGAGWLAPKVSIDYGLERMILPQSASAHHIGATIYF